MKKRILVLFIALIMLSGCSLFNKKENNEDVVPETPVKKEEFTSIDKSDLPEEEIPMMDLLSEYGKKIYAEKTYDRVEKKSDGTYFISINDFKDIYSYDISIFSTECNFDESGVIIDEDRKVHTYLDPKVLPVVAALTCDSDNNKNS